MLYSESGDPRAVAPGGAGDGGSSSSPYYAPPPGSAQAGQDYAGANDAYRRALIRFNSQRTGLLRQYGYAGDINPENGMMTNLRVDAGNMHGGLQELLHNQALEDQNAQYAAEDRGLHGGLAHQAESELHYLHGGQSSALAQSLFGNLSGLDSQQLDAKSTLDQALWQLTHSAASDAVTNGDYNPATTDGGSADGYSGNGGLPYANIPAVAPRGRIPMKTATRLVTAATSRGEPTSEHGAGSLGNPRAAVVAKKVLANAYTSGKKKRG